jgi:serine/threonine-protein kinase
MRAPAAIDAQAQGSTGDAEPASTAKPAARPKRHFLHIPFFGSSHDGEPEQETANTESTQQARSPDTAATETESSSTSSTAPEYAGDGDSATNLANADGGSSEYATRVQQSAGASAHASVALAISPWGEVFVDGKSIGVSPPLNEIELLPGSRVIEIRNGDFPPFTQRVELKAQQRIKIRYKFN